MDRIKKFGSFQAMNIGRTLVVSFWILTLFLGGWGYDIRMRGQYINGNKRKTCSIRVKVDLYDVCVYSI